MSTRTKVGAGESQAGLIPPTGDGGGGGFLSDVIVELGFATRDTVGEAVRAAQSPGTTVARVLVETGAITEEQLARATAERYGIDYIDLEGFDVDPAAANLIKPSAARRYQAVPVGFLGKGLLVAMADPADALGVNDIAVMTKLDVRPAVAARPALDGLLEALPLNERRAAEELAPVAEEPAPAVEEPAPAAEDPPVAEEPAPAVEDPPVEDEPPAEDSLSKAAPPKEGADDAETTEPDAAEEDLAVSAEVEELRARLGELESERDEDRERARHAESELRRIGADAEVRSAELDTLRTKLTAAETELVRVRTEADARGSEAAAMRSRAESAEAEAESALRRADGSEREAEGARREAADAVSAAADAQRQIEEARRQTAEAQREVAEAQREVADAQHRAAEAQQLVEELEAADARTEQARQALTELRQESERERERWSLAERDLRARLSDEETQRGELEERLAEVEGSAVAAERAFEELRLAQTRMRGALRALAEPDGSEAPDGD